MKIKRSDKHVEALGEDFEDAGSIPAVSTHSQRHPVKQGVFVLSSPKCSLLCKAEQQ